MHQPVGQHTKARAGEKGRGGGEGERDGGRERGREGGRKRGREGWRNRERASEKRKRTCQEEGERPGFNINFKRIFKTGFTHLRHPSQAHGVTKAARKFQGCPDGGDTHEARW